jgi:hypothetical protein
VALLIHIETPSYAAFLEMPSYDAFLETPGTMALRTSLETPWAVAFPTNMETLGPDRSHAFCLAETPYVSGNANAFGVSDQHRLTQFISFRQHLRQV